MKHFVLNYTISGKGDIKYVALSGISFGIKFRLFVALYGIEFV